MDRLWAPWRAEFIENPQKPAGCIFCLFPAEVGDDADRRNLILGRSRHSFVILNKFPYTSGHLTVIPRRHTAMLEELPTEEIADLMALLPDGALVVNIGRGRTLDTGALVERARRGRLRAALDVTDPEPLPAGHPLRDCPGVLVTPHVAGGSDTFHPRAERRVTEQVRRFAAGEPLRNVVAR